MAPKKNPLGLNRLQLKTLTLLQALAEDPDHAQADGEGGTVVTRMPHPHGDHFHLGHYIVSAADATGIANQSVWVALERKGLIARPVFPMMLTLSAAGRDYETGLKDEILHHGHH